MLDTKKELEGFDDRVNFIKCDISLEDEVRKMYEQISLYCGKLDYLVNNAGTNINSFIEALDINDFKKVINVNLIVKVICTKYAIPLFKK